MPLTVVILVALFAVQSRGTAQGRGLLRPDHAGLVRRHRARRALAHRRTIRACCCAFNPCYGVASCCTTASIGFVTLGAVFLAVTGAEALYADLGHFGREPIQTAWLVVVLPALALNYLGQGALVLADPKAIENPFFLLYPDWALLPMVVLATAATVIASQAVITGAYSLTRQAIQLGLLPRLRNPPHLGDAGRPDLHAAGQHAAAGRRAAAGRAVPLVERARLRLRHRGDRHHGGHRA